MASPLAASATAQAAPSRTPSVTALSTLFGLTQGGTTLTITGSNFRNVTGVRFGTASATNVKVLSSSQIQVTTPASSVAVADVRVVSTAGTSATSDAAKFAFHTAPPLTGASVSVTKSAGAFLICRSLTNEACGYVTATTKGFNGSVTCHVTKSAFGAFGSFWTQGANATTVTGMIYEGTSIEVTCDGIVGKNYNWAA
ncbi:MAG: IPT/TIG domain-containing protein [Micropruina sp.]|nr:IPT/TIG domain-containing protein [Micropruina sp.]